MAAEDTSSSSLSAARDSPNDLTMTPHAREQATSSTSVQAEPCITDSKRQPLQLPAVTTPRTARDPSRHLGRAYPMVFTRKIDHFKKVSSSSYCGDDSRSGPAPKTSHFPRRAKQSPVAMFNIKSIVSVVALVLPLASAAPAQLGVRAVLLPEDDPFYQAPATIASSAPGDILNSRKVSTSFFGLIPDPVEAWQLLYRTNAVNGTAISAVTTVFKPLVPKTDRFVSFHTAYDGAARDGKCDPSYNYQLGAPQEDIISSVEFLLLQAFLIDGYIVSSSDYEGPDAAFGAGRLEGMGVLDSMRAVANFRSTLGLTTGTPAVVGYGYSGGAIATGWAAGLQPNYAPELNIKGWAQGGTPANLTGTTVFIDGTLFSGFLPQALTGLCAPSAYGARLQPKIDSIVTTEGASELAFAADNCGVANLFKFPFKSVQSIEFQTLGDRVLYDPDLSYALNQQLMGQNAAETPTAPVYLFHATSDEIIPYANASTLYDEWCGYGASVDFVTYANGGHATTEVLGFPGAFNFVKDAFAGTVGGGCSKQTKLDSILNPLALGAALEPILVGLLNALATAGTKDANIKADLNNFAKTVT